jgi:hypothetical protein
MTDDREAKIRRRAHEIWEEQGKPEGGETGFWHQAEREVGGDTSGNRPRKTAALTRMAPETGGELPTAARFRLSR